jgi:hemerythrin-like domain-containing protein
VVKLTDALLGEHGAFRALFNTIEEMTATAGDVAQIESATAVLVTKINSHAALEEELLFPMLEPHVETNVLLDKMHAEHEQIRRGLGRIEDARDIGEAVEAVQQTVGVARSHFETEEEVLYALAQRVLDNETLIQLGEAWVAARNMKAEKDRRKIGG